jgi:hypothetical protein
MDFNRTGLPEKPLFTSAFAAGWGRFALLFPQKTEQIYLSGAGAMARLVFERGGDCRQLAVAACLAGPAVFSHQPDERVDKKVRDLAREIMKVEEAGMARLGAAVGHLCADARLFLQASAVMLLDRAAAEGGEESCNTYLEALALYSSARGGADIYRLDAHFERAARRAAALSDIGPHGFGRA